ncbi:MAG: tetratricopeptide repeat protein [Clostridiaceae bacterium]|nr:tetratricopeptide repeat protein [Clostridiaceae bacterium]
MRIMFCNIPWRENYRGEEGALESEPLCFESYNFYEIDNYYYGYCNSGEEIDLQKFKNIELEDLNAKNILVVWVSKGKIIGWYKKAQVYKKCIVKAIFNARRYEMAYNIKAKAKDCILLDVNNRVEFSQITTSSLLLLDLEKNPAVEGMKDILDYIENYKMQPLNKIMTEEDLSIVTEECCETIEDYLLQGEKFYSEYKDFEALAYYNKVIELEGKNIRGLNGRGLVLTSLNKYTLALKSLNKALRIDPLMEEAIYNKGIIYSAQGELKRGINCFKAALKINSTFDDTYVKIAFLYKAIGEDLLSKKYIQASIKLNKNNIIYQEVD